MKSCEVLRAYINVIHDSRDRLVQAVLVSTDLPMVEVNIFAYMTRLQSLSES